MKWFYYNDKWKRVGPFSDDEFKQLAQTGVILPSTPVENEDGRRAAAERVAGLFASPKPAVKTSLSATASSTVESQLQKLAERLATVDANLTSATKRLTSLDAAVGGECAGLTKRVAELEKGRRERAGLTKRVADLEKRNDANGETARRALVDLEQVLVDANYNLTQRVAKLEKGDLSKRLDALETSVGGARSGLTQRVAELEKKGGASGELSKRLDALETSVGGARSGLTKRVAELEKKGGASGDWAKRLEVVEQQGLAVGGLATRLAAAEKSGDAKVGALTKRVGELENRADASGVWTKRLDSLARRLETNDAEIAKRLTALEERDDATANASESTRRLNGLERRLDENVADWGERLRVVEKKVGERSPELETSRAFEGLVEKLNGLGEALAAFDARFERLAERLDALERRFDEEAKRNGGQSDEARRSEPENRDDKTTRPAFRPFGAPERESALGDVENDKDDVDLEEESLKLDFWSDDDGERNEENAVGDESATTARRWEPGKYRVGDDWPPGRYKAEIRRGWASIELELADDYRCYVLETDPNVDGYAPRCVLEAPEGAIATLDNPVELTYLGALR